MPRERARGVADGGEEGEEEEEAARYQTFEHFAITRNLKSARREPAVVPRACRDALDRILHSLVSVCNIRRVAKVDKD